MRLKSPRHSKRALVAFLIYARVFVCERNVNLFYLLASMSVATRRAIVKQPANPVGVSLPKKRPLFTTGTLGLFAFVTTSLLLLQFSLLRNLCQTLSLRCDARSRRFSRVAPITGSESVNRSRVRAAFVQDMIEEAWTDLVESAGHNVAVSNMEN